MAWEVTIRRPDGEPLGDLPTVCERIGTALPDVRFYRDPSGPERIAAARAAGVEFPEGIRQHFERLPAKVRAVFEGGGLSVVLYGFEADPLVALHAEVRGDGDPVPVLAAVCRPHGWAAAEDATDQPVELGGTAAGWEEFRAYRDGPGRALPDGDGAGGPGPDAAPDRAAGK